MKDVRRTGAFKKDFKLMGKRGKDLTKLNTVISALAQSQSLDPKFRDHALTGNWKGCRDCHIEPDWVLIYEIDDIILKLRRTGTHSDLGL